MVQKVSHYRAGIQGGLGGGAAPPRLLMKRKTNGTQLTSPIPDEIHDPPHPAHRSFYFHPPILTSPKKNSDPSPQYNWLPPAGNKWLVPYEAFFSEKQIRVEFVSKKVLN